MRWLLLSLGLVLSMPALTACKKGDQELCTKACWNAFELTYLRDLEAAVEAAPAAEREALRAEKLAELAKMKADPHYGRFEICLETCVENANDDMAKCYSEATTVEQVEACK